jgi:hypothetical protein
MTSSNNIIWKQVSHEGSNMGLGGGREEGKRMYRKISHRSSTKFLKISFVSVNNND